MYYYKLYGMRMASDLKFAQLVELLDEEQTFLPQIVIEERSLEQAFQTREECYYKIDKQVSYVSNSFCYMLIQDGEKIFYERKEGTTLQLLNAYILGWGIAILFHQREQLAIHCSCLERDGKALLISGNSGSGKSTIADELLVKGFGFMADDMSVVKESEDKEWIATAAFPYRKLCRDVVQMSGISADEMIYIDEDKDKFLVPNRGAFVDIPMPIRIMVILKVSNKDKVEVQELVGADKFQACMDALFLSPLLGEQLYVPEHGKRILQFASRILIYQIERPMGKNSKKEIVDAILKIWQRD